MSIDKVATTAGRRSRAVGERRPSRRKLRPRAVRLVLAIALLIVALVLAVPAISGTRRAPKLLHAGDLWGSGYVIVPQSNATAREKHEAVSQSRYLARRHGLPIVADTNAHAVQIVKRGETKR
jgi:hypothetical protein